MHRIDIVAVGTIDAMYKPAVSEYCKRLGAFCKLNITEIREFSRKEKSVKIECEGQEIIKRLAKQKSRVVLLDVMGTCVDSMYFDNIVKEFASITYVVGGSDGTSRQVKERADSTISLGGITLPHQLCRLVLTEQIYRGFMMYSGRTYHI